MEWLAIPMAIFFLLKGIRVIQHHVALHIKIGTFIIVGLVFISLWIPSTAWTQVILVLTILSYGLLWHREWFTKQFPIQVEALYQFIWEFRLYLIVMLGAFYILGTTSITFQIFHLAAIILSGAVEIFLRLRLGKGFDRTLLLTTIIFLLVLMISLVKQYDWIILY